MRGTAGRKAVVKLDGTTIATTNIPLADSFDTAETTELGDAAEAHIKTIRRVGLSLEMIWRPVDDAGQAALRTLYEDPDGEGLVAYYPLGDTDVGAPILTFTAICPTLGRNPNGAGGVVTASAELRLSDGNAPVRTAVV